MFKKALVIPDCHVPYHHKKAVDIILEIATDIEGLSEIVILGDFADFYAINSHGRHPKMMHILSEEIEAVNSLLDVIDDLFPDIKKVFIQGNHEFRLERYIINNAPALFGVTQWNLLFKLTQRPNWKSVHYGPMQCHRVLGSDLFSRHEPYSMSSAKASLSKCSSNLVYGHIHRKDYAIARRPDGKKVINFSPGWLGDLRKKDVFGYVKTPPLWEMGAAIVKVEGSSKDFELEFLDFDERIRCQYNGKIYK
jgi:hypothetical protein